MFSFRTLILFSFAAFCWGVNVSAQTLPFQPPQAGQQLPTVQQRVQQVPVQQPQMQVPPIQAPPMQAAPVQAPLFGAPQTGQSVYDANQSQPIAQPAAPQTQMGMNVGQPMNTGQSIRVATSNPGQSVPLYNPSGTNPVPQVLQPPAGQQGIPPGMAHVGRAEPANKVIPFFLSPEEQKILDEFLIRWERYSAAINRYDVNFDLFIYDPTIPGAQPNKAYKIAYGYFKYNANPRRFVYEIEGEWQGDKKIKRDGDKNPQIFAEKVIIDERSVHQYDYNSKTVRQINVPPEMIGKGIADSPLPLIFGAKADELKRRFSMKLENTPSEEIVRLYARPLLIEDQQEFSELEILLHRNNLTAQALRQWENNGKTYKVFKLQTPTINPRTISVLEDIRKWFTADDPRGWKREEMNWTAPSPIPAVPQPQIANPPQNSEVPLYRM